MFLDFPCGSANKESTCNVEDLGLIPGLGRFPWRKEKLPAPVVWPWTVCAWDCKELDTTEWLSLSITNLHFYPPSPLAYILLLLVCIPALYSVFVYVHIFPLFLDLKCRSEFIRLLSSWTLSLFVSSGHLSSFIYSILFPQLLQLLSPHLWTFLCALIKCVGLFICEDVFNLYP